MRDSYDCTLMLRSYNLIMVKGPESSAIEVQWIRQEEDFPQSLLEVTVVPRHHEKEVKIWIF